MKSLRKPELVARQAVKEKMDPVWATMTADQAETWMEENVTDMESAKTALKKLARAMTGLRDLVGLKGTKP